MSADQTITFITGNANKLAEVTAILSAPSTDPTGRPTSLPVNFTNRPIDLPEMQGTIESIVTEKARQAFGIVGSPVLVEDTCLAFNALGDLPGPYIKWFLNQLGPHQLHKLIDGFDDKSGRAICTFAYCDSSDGPVRLFQGVTDGTIVPSRGPTNFGWDSCFEYNGQTYAEMEKSEKNKISHRGRALAKFRQWLTDPSVEHHPSS